MPIDLVSHLGSAAIGALALGMLSYVVLLLFRIQSPAVRHATWTVVLVGMLIQIPLGVVAPTVAVMALPTLPTLIAPRIAEPARTPTAATRSFAPPNPALKALKRSASPTVTITGVYVAILTVLFFRLVFGYWILRRIVNRATPITDRDPGIFESDSFVAPGSVGMLRGRIILPQCWTEWNAARLRAVLAHERAHIRRCDWLIHIVSQVNTCIFWFHPLAWWLDRELAILAEEACDDVALSETEDIQEYAASLAAIARATAANGGLLNWRIMSMARESNVTRRVNRILNGPFPVPKPIGLLAWVTLFACSLPVIYLSAAVKLASARPISITLEGTAASASPDDVAGHPLLPQQNFSSSLSAQATPNQLPKPRPLITPPQREDQPITMCLLIDNSGSMRPNRDGVRAAALALVRASKPGDQVCIIDFNDEVSNALPHGQDFTSDTKEMEEALTHLDSRGGTAMRDAIGIAIDRVERTTYHHSNVLVLITEGNDNSSAVSQDELLNRLKISGVRVYSIGLMSEDDRRETAAAKLALTQLAEVSGGLAYYASDLAEVAGISPKVASEVRGR